MSDFKEFILRGNVVSLAVAVVIGAALLDVVNAVVSDIITPLIAAIGGQPDFSALDFHINDSRFAYGHLLNTIIAFLIVSLVVFYFIVKPMNALIRRAKTEPTPDPTTFKCPACLSEVTVGATRCPYCTSEIASTGSLSSSGSLA